jgi:hypothetical membrane protein
MKKINSNLIRIGGLCGLLFPIVTIFFIALAIYFAPWFSWTENWLSELAGEAGGKPIWSARGIESVLFNAGLIIGGAIGITYSFAVNKISIFKTHLGQLSSALIFFNMVVLSAIGIFPITTGILHDIVSVGFFILVPLALITTSIVLTRSNEKNLGGFFLVMGIISLCSLPFFFIPEPWGSNAIIETIPAFSLFASNFVLGFALFRGMFEFKENKE